MRSVDGDGNVFVTELTDIVTAAAPDVLPPGITEQPGNTEQPEEIYLSNLKPNPIGDFEWEVTGNLVTIVRCKARGTVVLPEKITGFPVGRIGSLNSNGDTLPSALRQGNAIPDGVTRLVIPETLTSIGDGAFYGCKSLVKLNLPSELRSIGRYAFYGCSNLKTLTIGTSLTSIGEGAFYNCRNLDPLALPSTLTAIGAKAFKNCNGR